MDFDDAEFGFKEEDKSELKVLQAVILTGEDLQFAEEKRKNTKNIGREV